MDTQTTQTPAPEPINIRGELYTVRELLMGDLRELGALMEVINLPDLRNVVIFSDADFARIISNAAEKGYGSRIAALLLQRADGSRVTAEEIDVWPISAISGNLEAIATGFFSSNTALLRDSMTWFTAARKVMEAKTTLLSPENRKTNQRTKPALPKSSTRSARGGPKRGKPRKK